MAAIAAFVDDLMFHVHTERAETARQAGVGRVLARSAFVQALPALLAESTAPA